MIGHKPAPAALESYKSYIGAALKRLRILHELA